MKANITQEQKRKQVQVKDALTVLKAGSIKGSIDGAPCRIGTHESGGYWIEYGEIYLTHRSKTEVKGYLSDMDFIRR